MFESLRMNGIEYAWPAADGANTEVLQTDGSGTLTWVANAGSPTMDTIADPAADVTLVYDDNETDLRTWADTNEDMFTLQGIGAFGDVSVVRIEQITGAATDGTVLEVVAADSNVDPLVVSSSGKANALVVGQNTGIVTIAGVASGTNTLVLTAGDITLSDGDATITGDLTVTGTTYESAIAPAAGNLTIDANAAGTVNIGSISTGAITVGAGNATSVIIGAAATDTLGITSIINTDVTLDDGTTDSPKLIFKDSDDEQAEIYQDQSSDDLNVELNDASDSLAVTVGNISAGTPNVDVITLNGDDLYVADDAEIDGTLVVDTDLDVNGTSNISGVATFTENVLMTVGADEYLQLDADSAANTGTAGVIDLNVQSATNTHKAMSITYQLEDNATAAYGIYVDIDDDATGGETFSALHVLNSAGTASTTIGVDIANTVDTGFNMANAAAATSIAIDASAIISTQTAGLIDIVTIMSEDTASVINIDVESEANGAGEFVHGIYINLDDDADNADNELTALTITTDGGAGTGLMQGINILGANMDAALWAETGYVRIGTGSSPGVTPGDDDLYVEGTAEFDDTIYADGNITGDGATVISGVLSDSEDVADTGNVIAATECGKMFFLNDATEDASILPAISATPAGCWFEFYTTAAPSGASYTIVTGNTHENLLYGSVVEAETDTGDDGPVAQAQDTITLVDGQFLIGDVIRIVSDGGRWFVNGQVQKDGAVTFGTT